MGSSLVEGANNRHCPRVIGAFAALTTSPDLVDVKTIVRATFSDLPGLIELVLSGLAKGKRAMWFDSGEAIATPEESGIGESTDVGEENEQFTWPFVKFQLN